jgi:predicted RNase H-like HicB family nuclease
MRIAIDQDVDGRWIAEVTALPGVMVSGKTLGQALRKVKRLARRFLEVRRGCDKGVRSW